MTRGCGIYRVGIRMKYKMTADIKKFKVLMREAIANYMGSEGCSCCRNTDDHDLHTQHLAKLLNVPKYPDGSGYNFRPYRTKKTKGGS